MSNLIFFFKLILLVYTTNLFGVKNKIVVGVYDDPPLVYSNTKKDMKGIAIDFLDEIALKFDLDIVYKQYSFTNLLKHLKNKKIDILVGIAKSKQRAKLFDFGTVPLLNNYAIIFRNPKVKVNTVFDLEGLNVAGLKNDIHYSEFKKLMYKYNLSYQEHLYNTNAEVFKAVSDGKTDAAILNRNLTNAAETTFKAVSTLIIFNKTDIGFAYPKGSNEELIKLIDSELKQQKLSPTSTYTQSLNKWLKREKVTRPWIKYLILYSFIILIIFVIFFIYLKEKILIKTQHLSQAKYTAEKNNQKRSAFIESIETQIKSPLNLLLGQLSILGISTEDQDFKYQLLNMQENTLKLINNINDSLFISSSLQEQQPKENNSNFNIRDLFDTILIDIIKNCPAKIKLITTFDTSLNHIYSANKQAITSIITDILLNSFEFTKKGEVTFKAQTISPSSISYFLILEFTDTGAGISPDKIDDLLLDSNAPPHTLTERKSQVSQILVVKNLTKQINGTLQVKSSIDKGTSVNIKIPISSYKKI